MRFLVIGLSTVLLVVSGAGAAWANGSTSECLGCHPGFSGFGATHTLHTGIVSECDYCHTVTGDTPLTGSSRIDPENSCSGCHTKDGTAAHHITTAASGCGCHAAGDPGAESDVPPYYGTAATALTDPCDDSLDNDGDNVYDGDDTDCGQTPIGDRSWSVIKEVYGAM